MQFQSLEDMGFTEDQLIRFKNSRKKIDTDRAVYSVGGTELKGRQCHANLSYHLSDVLSRNVFVVNDFEPCFSKARKGLKEFLLECHLADDSPWKELFPHLKLFEYDSNLYYFFKLDNCPDRLKRLLLNFSIACRALSEGDSSWKCDKESHTFGFKHYLYLMERYNLNWRQAAVLSRVITKDDKVRTNVYGTFLWNKHNGALLNHHFLNGVFSDQFLKGVPLDTNNFSSNGNDQALWGTELYLEEYSVGGKNKPSLRYLFGGFFPAPDNPKWTAENLVKIVKGEWDKKDDGKTDIAA
jgi:hypothetical protein